MEMNEYLARLIDSCSDAIISTDKDGNVVLFSARAEALLGYRAKEIAGRNISVLYGDAAGARQVALEMRKRGWHGNLPGKRHAGQGRHQHSSSDLGLLSLE